MTCKYYQKLLVPLLFNELDERQKKSVEHHLGQCPKCRKEWDELSAARDFYVKKSVGGTKFQPPIRIIAKTERKKSHSRYKRLIPALIFSSIILILFFTLFVPEKRERQLEWTIENSWETNYQQTIRQMNDEINSILSDEFFN